MKKLKILQTAQMGKKMNKIIALISILVILFLSACSRELSQEDAIIITQDFVNGQVKFFVQANETNANQTNATVLDRAAIAITDVQKSGKYWQVAITINSNQTGKLKTADLVFLIDSKSGEIAKWGKPETFSLKQI